MKGVVTVQTSSTKPTFDTIKAGIELVAKTPTRRPGTIMDLLPPKHILASPCDVIRSRVDWI